MFTLDVLQIVLSVIEPNQMLRTVDTINIRSAQLKQSVQTPQEQPDQCQNRNFPLAEYLNNYGISAFLIDIYFFRFVFHC